MNTVKRLWAPWRVTYVKALDKKSKGCVFCNIRKSKNDKANYVFFRARHCHAVLNIYPYNNGHVLIVPNRHVGDLRKLLPEEKKDLFARLEKSQGFLDRVLSPRGYNIGMNIGRVAGAGFPGHLHIHVLPRWGGDVNFMPVIGNTKVVSQSLAELYRQLKKCAHAKKSKTSK